MAVELIDHLQWPGWDQDIIIFTLAGEGGQDGGRLT